MTAVVALPFSDSATRLRELAILALFSGGLGAIILISRSDVGNSRLSKIQQAPGQLSLSLFLFLLPLLLLNIVYPFVSSSMAAVVIDGVPLTLIVLGSSVTVPWLAQAACLSMYRATGHLVYANKSAGSISDQFCKHWPASFVFALPLVLFFVLPFWLFTGWPIRALGIYAASCVLHLIFVQSLVLANLNRRSDLWAIAWSAYSFSLFACPTVWWLPPVVATVTQLVPIFRHLPNLWAWTNNGIKAAATDSLRGLMTGSVMWSDKFIIFLVTEGDFPVIAVFASMVPSVIAYNIYFVNYAPNIDRNVKLLHANISQVHLSDLKQTSHQLVLMVNRSIVATGAIASLLMLLVSSVYWIAFPSDLRLVAAATTASWIFLILALLNYQLDYVGEHTFSQILGTVHVALCFSIFLAFSVTNIASSNVSAYLSIAVLDISLIVAACIVYRRSWRQPEYTLFWRHAIKW